MLQDATIENQNEEGDINTKYINVGDLVGTKKI